MNSIGEGVEPETILDVAKAFIWKEGAQPNKQAMARSNLMLQVYIDAYSVITTPPTFGGFIDFYVAEASRYPNGSLAISMVFHISWCLKMICSITQKHQRIVTAT